MNILVVGKNSYIAQEFVSLVTKDTEWNIQYLSVRDEQWRTFGYGQFDAIIYFAAIVHHPEITDEVLYNKVNVDIPCQMALIAREQGTRQFVYISTCAVWGLGPRYGQANIIDTHTPLKPVTLYGKSKLAAEQRLANMNGSEFHVACVRLPNVYGKNCPGTFYHRIEALSKLPVLPIDRVRRPFSLISVENVAKALKIIIEKRMDGVLCPQDTKVNSIVERVQLLAQQQGRRQYQTKVMWPLMWLIDKIVPNKYLNNLYGGYHISKSAYPTIIEEL